MLLRFSVANYLSMKDPQALSLTASSLKDVEDGLIECSGAPDGRVLPAAMIYGANASGKSNLVDAMRFMRWAALYSHRQGEPDGRVPRIAFALAPNCAEESSSFNADFVIDRARYHYGFEALDEAFAAEWLYVFPSNRRQILFERRNQTFNFGRALKGRNKIIADLTRPDSLFLSTAVQNDHEQLSKVSRFFLSIWGASATFGFDRVVSSGDKIDERVIKFLRNIGTGVVDYRWLETDIPQKERRFRKEIGSSIQKFAAVEPELFGRDKRSTVELAHETQNGDPVFLDLERESAGTVRLLRLLGRVFRALDRGSPIVIDELDASLHTRACEAVLALFCSPETNPKGAQLIATTHDTNLLRSPLLRRDQVWFTEKDTEGATHLYPLTEIRTRKGDNIEKGYLQGRYGAIPFAGRISDLIAAG